MLADVDVLLGGSSPVGFNRKIGLEFGDHELSSGIVGEKSNSSLLSGSPRQLVLDGRCSPRSGPSSPLIVLSGSLSRWRLRATESRKMPVAVPRRPCLVVRCDVLDLPGSSRSKKKVVFADDRGFPLTLVRTMTEPSNVPPQLSVHLLAEMAKHETGKEVCEPWEVDFSQPASDYLDFRNRLESNNVSLENVIVKETDQLVLGTVKVRNLVFQKEVFIRSTSDDWKTQEDIWCTYVANSPSSHGVAILYDTFSFRLPLPPTSRKIEFCVCFKCAGAEFWDNNTGRNYSINRKQVPDKRGLTPQTAHLESTANKFIDFAEKLTHHVKPNTQLESWSEFASWDHLNNNNTPYW